MIPETEIDFEKVSPTVLTRPEHCPICAKRQGEFFGRLNFAEPGQAFEPQYCPMHSKAIRLGRLSPDRVRLVPA